MTLPDVGGGVSNEGDWGDGEVVVRLLPGCSTGRLRKNSICWESILSVFLTGSFHFMTHFRHWKRESGFGLPLKYEMTKLNADLLTKTEKLKLLSSDWFENSQRRKKIIIKRMVKRKNQWHQRKHETQIPTNENVKPIFERCLIF